LLHNLPVHEVKIDKSFVDNADTDPAAEALIAMIIDGAHRLGLTVIAERVERDEQLRRLRALGCDAAQGYLLSYPSAIDAPRTSQVTASV
jgi:EAL domain-containing protein (putative c-di-GMP-specific phosphodiesterase class I)